MSLHTNNKIFYPKIGGILLVIFLIFISTYTVNVGSSSAAINKQFNYQGKLTNTSNVSVADGTYNIEFKLYTASSSGVAIWTETRTSGNKVQVTNGLFSVMLGSVTTLDGVDFNQTLYLGINIGGTGSPSWDGEMAPRKILGAMPAAIEAYNLGGASSTQYIRSDQYGALTASSSQSLLTLTQNGIGNLLDVYRQGALPAFTIFNNGNVGVGTSSPAREIHLAGTDGDTRFRISDTNSTGLGAVEFYNDTGLGGVFFQAGSAYTAYGGANSFNLINVKNAPLAFGTNNTIKATILGDGNFGIGTTTPGYLLSVAGTSRITGASIFDSTLNVTGLTTLLNASSTNFSVSGNSYLGTVAQGTWNGTAIGATYGGTAQTTYATGDMLYASGANTLAKRTIGTTGDVLSVVGGVPSWVATSTLGIGGGSGSGTVASGITGYFGYYPSSGTTIDDQTLLYTNGTNIGIGTSSPSTKLTISDTSGNSATFIYGGAGGVSESIYYNAQGRSRFGYDGVRGVVAIDDKNTSGATSNKSIVFDTNTFERMRITNAGKVGIGTTTPSAKLDIYGAAGAEDVFAVSSSTNSRLLLIAASGNVGIGTTTPGHLLSVAGTSRFTGASILDSTLNVGGATVLTSTLDVTGLTTLLNASSTNFSVSGNSYLGTVAQGTWNGTAIGATYGGTAQTTYATGDMLYASGANTLAKRTIGTTGDVLSVVGGVPSWVATSTLGITASLSGGTNGYMARWTSGSALSIGKFLDNGTVAGINATSSSFTLNLQGDSGLNPFNIASSTGTSLFNVNQTGNVGVGTTTPSSNISIAGSSPSFELFNSNSTGQSWKVRAGVAAFGVLDFYDQTNASSRMVITNAGRVGIGTTTPTSSLDVWGTMMIGTSTRPLFFANPAIDMIGIGTTTPNALLDIQGRSGSIAQLLEVASSSGRSFFHVMASGNVGVGTSSPIAQFTIGGIAGNTNPFVIASSTGTQILTMRPNGFMGISSSTPSAMLSVGGSITTSNLDYGNAVAGSILTIGRNTNATASSTGSLGFITSTATGTPRYIWVDRTGVVRVNSVAPNNLAADTTGTVVGAQTSTRDTKQDIEDYMNYDIALAMVDDAPLHTFRYRNEVSELGSENPLVKKRIGFIADEVDPVFMWGNVIDQVSVNGLLIGSVKALNNKIEINASTTAATNASTTKSIIKLDMRISALEANSRESYNNSNASGDIPLGGKLISILQSFGTEMIGGVSYLKNVFVKAFTTQNLTIKGDDVEKTGFTIYDRKTKEPLCVFFEDGVQKIEKGECPDSTKIEDEKIPLDDNPTEDPNDSPPVDNPTDEPANNPKEVLIEDSPAAKPTDQPKEEPIKIDPPEELEEKPIEPAEEEKEEEVVESSDDEPSDSESGDEAPQ